MNISKMNNPSQSGWLLVLILIATPVHAAQSKFGSLPPRYNPKAVEYLVDQCVSYRIPDMQTDYAAEKLEQTCLNDVLAYRWKKIPSVTLSVKSADCVVSSLTDTPIQNRDKNISLQDMDGDF